MYRRFGGRGALEVAGLAVLGIALVSGCAGGPSSTSSLPPSATPSAAPTVRPTPISTTEPTPPPTPSPVPPTSTPGTSVEGECLLQAGAFAAAISDGRCYYSDFATPFSFEAPGWRWIVSPTGHIVALNNGEARIAFYRYGGEVVTDYCADASGITDPPTRLLMPHVNEVAEWLAAIPDVHSLLIGRSVGINPAWQFDLQSTNTRECAEYPSLNWRVGLWSIEGQPAPESIGNEQRMRAYFILVHDSDIVVMTATASGAEYQADFELAADEIFESLSFDDVVAP